MSVDRKINRNKLKNAYKSNKINRGWREYQINKYGIQNWCKKFNSSRKINNKANKVAPDTAYHV